MTKKHSNRARATFPSGGLSLGVGVLVAAGTWGCGDDDESGAAGPTDDIELGDTGDGDLVLDNQDFDGGRRDITAEQANALQSAACTGWGGEGETLPVVLQLVVDVSRSMTLNAPGSRGSKWQATREALEDAISGLPPSVSVGVLYYPNMFTDGSTTPTDVNACVDTNELVPIAPLGSQGSDHRASLQSSLQSVEVDGYTPTYDAYSYALENSLLPFDSIANKFMLLITDGAPTFDQGCLNVAQSRGDQNGVADAPTQPIIDEISSAFTEHDVRTFLIGSPGSEESSESNTDMRPWLSQSAVLGGTAAPGCSEDGPDFCHLDMTQEPDFATALSEGLSTIAGQIIDECTFQTPEPPDNETINPNETNLVISWGDGTASLILPDGKGDCTDGWQFDDSGDVVLCPQTCDQIKADDRARVQLTFGCSPEETDMIFR